MFSVYLVFLHEKYRYRWARYCAHTRKKKSLCECAYDHVGTFANVFSAYLPFSFKKKEDTECDQLCVDLREWSIFPSI